MSTTSQATTQVYHIFIRATADQVWTAVTEPDQIAGYFHGCVVDRRLEPGGHWLAYSPDCEQLWNDGRVIEARAPALLSHTWTTLWDAEAAVEPHSRVTWQIEPVDGGVCKLTLVHDQLEHAPRTAHVVAGEGWMRVLSGLKTLVETGQPLG